LPAKKMKFLFKRYLEYEREHGDASTVAHVKQRAMDYVSKNQ
jgi:rRNA biogenesis protein RRP5